MKKAIALGLATLMAGTGTSAVYAKDVTDFAHITVTNESNYSSTTAEMLNELLQSAQQSVDNTNSITNTTGATETTKETDGTNGTETGGTTPSTITDSTVPTGITSELSSNYISAIPATSFSDIKGHWAEKAISKWEWFGVISGTDATHFSPNNNISRADFSTIVGRIVGVSEQTELAMNTAGLDGSKYYTKYVSEMSNIGALLPDNGTQDLRPLDEITREEAALLLCGAFGVVVEDLDASRLQQFSDWKEVSDDYREALETLISIGYMNGTPDGKLNPKSNLTRAEAVTLLNNILNLYDTVNKVENLQIGTRLAISNANGVEVENSTIKGTLRAFTPYLNITKSGVTECVAVYPNGNTVLDIAEQSSIGRITVVGNATLKADSTVTIQRILVSEGAELSVPDTKLNTMITLRPSARLTLPDGEVYMNTHDFAVSFKGIPTSGELAETLDIEFSVQLKSDNTSYITVNKVASSREKTIKEYGALINKGTTIPTINSFDTKRAQRTTEQLTGRHLPDDIWTYRGFVEYTDGTVGYTAPQFILGYSYNVSTELQKDAPVIVQGTLKSIVKPVYITIEGANIPEVESIVVISGMDTYTDHFKETGVSVDTTEVGKNYTTKVFRANVTYPVDSEGNISPDKYHGVLITFKDGIVDKRYPLETDNKAFDNDANIKLGRAELSPVSTSETAKPSDEIYRFNVTDNMVKFLEQRTPSSDEQKEGDGGNQSNMSVNCGIAYKIVDSSSTSYETADSSWKHVASIGITPTGLFSVSDEIQASLLQPNNKIVYSAYVKTDKGTVYSDVRSISLDSAPVFNGQQNTLLNHNGTIATLKLGIVSQSDINMQNSTLSYSLADLPQIAYDVASEQSRNVSNVDNDINSGDRTESLKAAWRGPIQPIYITPHREVTTKTLDELGATYDAGMLSLTIQNLSSDTQYAATLHLENKTGFTSDIQLQFNTLM